MKSFTRIFFVGVAFATPFVAGAQVFTGSPSGPVFTGSPSGPSCNSLIGFCNPLRASTICDALKIFLNAILSLAVPVAVLFLVYAGFRLVWARGNSKTLPEAKSNLWHTMLGIGIFLGAWLLGQIIANTIGSLANQSGVSTSYIGACGVPGGSGSTAP